MEDLDPDEAAGILANFLGGAIHLEENDNAPTLIHAWLLDEKEGHDKANQIVAILGEMFPQSRVALAQVSYVEDQDWMAQWRKTIKPIALGARIIVTPTFDRPEPGHGKIEVILDPGMAFGSGHHASTELCVMAMERHAPKNVLDIGCGSGILAIIAARLGAQHTLGVDVDPEAVETARKNVEQNHVAHLVDLAIGGPDIVDGEWDMIVANLYLDAHQALAPEYKRLAAPGGVVIISGLRNNQADNAMDRLLEEGFTSEDRMEKDGWTALDFQNPFGNEI